MSKNIEDMDLSDALDFHFQTGETLEALQQKSQQVQQLRAMAAERIRNLKKQAATDAPAEPETKKA